MPPTSSEEPAPRVLDFLQELLSDREQGAVKPLSEYLAHFSGHDEEIARHYLEIAAPAGPAEPAAGLRPDGEDDRRVGRFRLVEELGRGGQGVVYLADDSALDRRVALKVLNRGFAGADEAHLRLEREARLLSKLEHPGICPVYDRGRDRGRDYIVMRYVPGDALDVRLGARAPEQRAELNERLRLVEACARALHVAHEAGVIHRDVKPRNIVVQPDGSPVLLDFGLGRDEAEAVALTRTGDVFGTLDYMSPEQIDGAGAPPGRQCDVWALGAILYESLAGEPPFKEPTVHVTTISILQREPERLRDRNAHVSGDLEVVVATALEKDRARRYQSALDLAEDLRRVRAGEPVSARPAGTLRKLVRWGRTHPTAAMALSLGLASGVLLGALTGYFRGEQDVLARARDEAISQMVRVADLERAERLLARESDELWPVASELVRPCEDWLRDAAGLEERRSEHEQLLSQLRGRQGPDGRYADDGERIADERQTALLAFLDELSARRPDVEERRRRSASLRERSIDREVDAWSECVADVARSPHYDGLALAPQEGLVPLGVNAHGLWEFWVVETGERPKWTEQGAAPPGERTGVALVLLPAARAMIGPRPDDPDEQGNELPRHVVALDAFLIGKFELTQGQWSALDAGENPATYRAGHPHFDEEDPGWSHPVESVDWAGAVAVLWRNGLELPTEAQWEYACRAATEAAFSFGADWRLAGTYGNFQGREATEFFDQTPVEEYADSHVLHAPVGSYAPNPFGLHDMHGNVWEWCRDGYGSYSECTPRAGDGLRTPAADSHRPVRGGTFRYPAIYGRSSRRVPVPVGSFDFDLGLRPARSLKSL